MTRNSLFHNLQSPTSSLRPPLDAVLAVTYRCNARCAMCGIWRTDAGPDLPVNVYRKLPPDLRDINLTGGEPFLREDLPAVHAACREACPKAQTIISTNGLLPDRIVAMTREMARVEPNIGVAVSLDGPAEVHDRLRGVKGAFDKAVAAVEGLRDAGFTNLRFAFTAGHMNVSHMAETYELARELGVQFTCAIEHTSEHYFHVSAPAQKLPSDKLRGQLISIMQSELGSFSPKRWARAYFMRGLHEFAAGRGRLLPCRAGLDHFFMDPEGDIFTCNAAPYKMGNLKEADFDTLWDSPLAGKSRDKAARCKTGCWMVCTARTAIKAAWPSVLAWALKQKLFGLSLGGG